MEKKVNMNTRIRHFAVVLAVALALMIAPQFAVADNVYATLHGVATDATGAIITNADVTATNTQTGVKTAVRSNDSGFYEFTRLPVGSYTVTATKQGFKTFKSTQFTLTVNQTYDLPVHLEVGSVSETVEVRAEAVQVETTSIQQQTLVGAQSIVDLPLIGRNFTQLEQLAPGVMASNDRFGTFSVNGSQTQQSSYLVNGLDVNDIPLNTPQILPSPDAIQEFNLISSTINPEYGRNSGGVVNALIKNGTNQFHGNVFEFYRDTFLNTHNYFSSVTPVFHQNQFGGTFGGPVWKDKTFFFLSYQGVRARTSVTQTTPVYSSAQRAGDFSAFLSKTTNDGNKVTPFALIGDDGVLYPAGTRWICNPACANQIFHPTSANFGKLPTSNFNALAAGLMNQFVPLPNLGNNFTFNPITNTIADQGIVRVDHNFSSADQIWGVAIFNHSPSNAQLAFTGATLIGWPEVDSREVKDYNLAWNHTFNTTTLNELRLGYARFNFDAVEPTTAAQPSSFGFTGINSQNTVSASMPRVSVTGLFTLGFSTNGPQPRKDQTYQFTDNFSKVIGKHTYKFGFDVRRFQVDNPFFGRNNGSFTFSTAAFNSSGNAGLDFLLGIPSTYSQGAGGVINARAYEYYTYGQDQWKVRNNLTLTYGAGYQIDTPFNSHQFGGEAVNCFIPGQQSTIFPTAPVGLNFPGDGGCNQAGGVQIHYGHIAPRAGFAYSPHWGLISGSGNKFSVRGGFGVYFNRIEEEGALQNLGAPPFGVNSGGIADIAGHPSFAAPFVDISSGASLANKFPFTSFPQPGSTTVNWAKLEPFGLNTFDSNFTTPYSMNFNLSVQREFPANTVVSVGYLGALGRHLYRAYDANPITAAGQAACKATAACVANASLQHLLFPADSLFGNSNVFGGVGQQHTDGTSNYNALQANITKGMTHGLSLIASYTWSHAIDNGSGLENSGFGGANRGVNLLIPSLNIGDSAFDARQRLVLGYNYTIPNLHHLANWAPDKVFGGWKMTGITTLQTGFPFSVLDSNPSSLSADALDFFAGADSPNQVKGVTTLNPRNSTFGTLANYWFDPATFTAVPTCTFVAGVLQNGNVCGRFGNAGRDSFHGPGINNTDLALLKDTKITERTMVEVGIEGYNLFNHTQFCTATSCVVTNIQSPNFGRILAAAPGRLVQLRAKITF
jgi:hypothetical protein